MYKNIRLRDFASTDIPILQKYSYPQLSEEKIQELIDTWKEKKHNDVYFEMFAIEDEQNLVGSISLFQHTSASISCGPVIFPEYRQKNYATEAMIKVMELAKEKEYKIAVAQIRVDNEPSLALHKKLGFELDHKYINQKGNEVFFFTKSLL